jgi:hypothetical protein
MSDIFRIPPQQGARDSPGASSAEFGKQALGHFRF